VTSNVISPTNKNMRGLYECNTTPRFPQHAGISEMEICLWLVRRCCRRVFGVNVTGFPSPGVPVRALLHEKYRWDVASHVGFEFLIGESCSRFIVKVSLTPEQFIKAQRGRRGIARLFL
jgi:hypothetical protein